MAFRFALTDRLLRNAGTNRLPVFSVETMQTADRMMNDGRSLAQTLHFWLRIQSQNWEDGFPPGPEATCWICLAMTAARQGSLGRVQECILHAILQDLAPPPETGDYSLASFQRDLSAFQTRYLDSR